MKVFIVFLSHENFNEILSVFQTKEQAEEYINGFNRCGLCKINFSVIERDIVPKKSISHVEVFYG